MQRRGAVVSALVSAACFGTMAIIARLLYQQGAEPLQVLVWRFGLAALLLSGYTAVTRPGALRVGRADVARFAAISLLGYAAASLCFFFALRFVDASIAAILLYTYPAIIVVYETATGCPLSPARVTAVALTFIGCVLVVDPFNGALGIELPGLLLGLGAGLGYASFSVLGDRLLTRSPKTVLMSYMFAFASATAAVAALVTGSTLSVSGWRLESWGLLVALVLVPTFAAVLLYLRAVQELGASQAAILSTFEPVFTLALAVVLLGERLSLVQWAGSVLVLGGVVVAERVARSTEPVAVV